MRSDNGDGATCILFQNHLHYLLHRVLPGIISFDLVTIIYSIFTGRDRYSDNARICSALLFCQYNQNLPDVVGTGPKHIFFLDTEYWQEGPDSPSSQHPPAVQECH
jgi:hypothetical protein